MKYYLNRFDNIAAHVCLLMLAVFSQGLCAQEIPELQTSYGHEARVNKLTFSKDGEFLLSASEDQTVRLWNGRTYKLIRLFQHPAPVSDVTISSDNKRVVTAADQIYIWDRLTGMLIRTIEGAETIVSFDPTGSYLLTGNQLRDAATLELIHDFGKKVDKAAFHPEQPLLAIASGRIIYRYQLPVRTGSAGAATGTGLVLLDSFNVFRVHELNSVSLNRVGSIPSYEWSYSSDTWYEYFGPAPDSKPQPYSVTSLIFCENKIIWGDKLVQGKYDMYGSNLVGYVNAWEWEKQVTAEEQDMPPEEKDRLENMPEDWKEQWQLGKEIQMCSFQNFIPYALAYHPGQKYLVAGGCIPQYPVLKLALIDPETFTSVTPQPVSGPPGNVQDLAVHPRKEQVLIAGISRQFLSREIEGDIRYLDFGAQNAGYRLLQDYQYANVEIGNTLKPNLVRLAPNGKTLLLAAEGHLYFFDLGRGELVHRVPLIEPEERAARKVGFDEEYSYLFEDFLKAEAIEAVFTRDGEHLIVERQWIETIDQIPARRISIKRLNLQTYQWETTYVNEIFKYAYENPSIIQDPEGNYLLIPESENENDRITVYNIRTGEAVRRPALVEHVDNWPTPWLTPAESMRTALPFKVEAEGNSLIYTPAGGAPIRFEEHTGALIDWQLDEQHQRLYSIGEDGFLRIGSLNNGREIAYLQLFGGSQYLIGTPDNYYLCTPAAAQGLSFIHKGVSYSFEEFDLNYNRPDKVLEALSSPEKELIEAYHRAYKKRLAVMEIEEEQLNVNRLRPVIQFVDLSAVPQYTDRETCKIDLQILDHPLPMAVLHTWVNGVPVGHLNGEMLQERIAGGLLTIDLELTPGPNRIEISVEDQSGVESQRIETFVTFQGTERPDLYVIAVGVSKFAESDFNLQFAHKDAQDLSNLLTDADRLFEHVFVETLFDESVTVANVRQLKERLMNSRARDRVVLFIASHGVLDENLDYYLATHPMDFTKPGDRGLPYAELEALLDGIPARQKLLLIDACHSGEVDKDNIRLSEEAVIEGEVTFRSFGGRNLVEKQVGLANSFDLMKRLYADLRRGTGATVISATSGAAYAIEGGGYNNGIFTYSLLQGLTGKKADLNQDGQISVSELEDYVSSRVPVLTGGAQQPTSRIVNLSNDWRIW